MTCLGRSASLSGGRLERGPETAPAPQFLQKWCGMALLWYITLHNPPELKQSESHTHSGEITWWRPCQCVQKGPLLMVVGAMTLFEWPAGSPADIPGRMDTIGAYLPTCPIDNIRPLFAAQFYHIPYDFNQNKMQVGQRCLRCHHMTINCSPDQRLGVGCHHETALVGKIPWSELPEATEATQ